MGFSNPQKIAFSLPRLSVKTSGRRYSRHSITRHNTGPTSTVNRGATGGWAKPPIRNIKVDHPRAASNFNVKKQLHRNYAESPSKLPRNWGIGAAQLIPNPGNATQRKRHQMGIKERVKLNAPAVKSTPPAREMGVGSHRDGVASFRSKQSRMALFTGVYSDVCFFPCISPCDLPVFGYFDARKTGGRANLRTCFPPGEGEILVKLHPKLLAVTTKVVS